MSSVPNFLLSIFARGGMDGLAAVVPYDDPALQAARTTTKYNPPGSGLAPEALSFERATATHPKLGLSPALSSLKNLYDQGLLSFVHNAGTLDPSRSHFSKQFFMEMGWVSTSQVQDPKGLYTRYMEAVAGQGGAPRAISLTKLLPDYCRGSSDSVPVPNALNYNFPGEPVFLADRQLLLSSTYLAAGPPTDAPFATMEAGITTVNNIIDPAYTGHPNFAYSGTPLGKEIKYAAQFARDTSGPDIVHIDTGGWDTHSLQGIEPGGGMYGRLEDLAKNIEAFLEDMKSNPLRQVSVIVVSEFGRSLHENDTAGTDHGDGGLAIVAGDSLQTVPYGPGGSLQKGKLVANFFTPPLNAGDPNLDVVTHNDVRDIQAELMIKRLCLPAPTGGPGVFEQVFNTPDYTYTPLGLFL